MIKNTALLSIVITLISLAHLRALEDNHVDGGYLLLSGSSTADPESFTESTSNKHLLWNPLLGSLKIGRGDPEDFASPTLGAHAFSFGDSRASGNFSFAFGLSDQHGQGTESSGSYSFAFGENVVASSSYSFGFGREASVSGSSAIAFGLNSQASGRYSVSIGEDNVANSTGSVALGENNTADGFYSFAVGRSNRAEDHGFALGQSISASSSEYIVGRFNDPENPAPDVFDELSPLFVVGAGESSNEKANGFTLFNDGSGLFKGKVIVGRPTGDIPLGRFE